VCQQQSTAIETRVLSIMDLKEYYLHYYIQLSHPTIASNYRINTSTLNWISNYSIYQILDVKLDALDGDFLQQQQAATGGKKNDTKWRLILFKLINYNLQHYNITTLQHYNNNKSYNNTTSYTMRYFLNF